MPTASVTEVRRNCTRGSIFPRTTSSDSFTEIPLKNFSKNAKIFWGIFANGRVAIAHYGPRDVRDGRWSMVDGRIVEAPLRVRDQRQAVSGATELAPEDCAVTARQHEHSCGPGATVTVEPTLNVCSLVRGVKAMILNP